jgi:hypothetical protein
MRSPFIRGLQPLLHNILYNKLPVVNVTANNEENGSELEVNGLINICVEF